MPERLHTENQPGACFPQVPRPAWRLAASCGRPCPRRRWGSGRRDGSRAQAGTTCTPSHRALRSRPLRVKRSRVAQPASWTETASPRETLTFFFSTVGILEGPSVSHEHERASHGPVGDTPRSEISALLTLLAWGRGFRIPSPTPHTRSRRLATARITGPFSAGWPSG